MTILFLNTRLISVLNVLMAYSSPAPSYFLVRYATVLQKGVKKAPKSVFVGFDFFGCHALIR